MVAGPKPIAGNFGNRPAGWTSVDAAVEWDNDKVYFFRGAHYLRYDKDAAQVDAGSPKAIADHRPALFTQNLDSAFNNGDGKAYFFKGNVYDRVDIGDGLFEVDAGYPANIVGNSRGALF